MIKLVRMTGIWYYTEIDADDLQADIEDVIRFAEEGTPVILVDYLETAEEFILDAELINADE